MHKAMFPKGEVGGRIKGKKKVEKLSCAVNLNTFVFSLFTCYVISRKMDKHRRLLEGTEKIATKIQFCRAEKLVVLG